MLNPVAETLTGWVNEEARGREVEEVFRIVNEETRRTVESPVARVLRDGVVVGLANHTALIARDGSERPIADSGAPIREAEGAITGVVLVFRDQTEERAAQRALRETASRLDLALRSARMGAWSLDLVVNKRHFDDQVCRLLGIDPSTFTGSAEEFFNAVHPDDRDAVEAASARTERAGDAVTE